MIFGVEKGLIIEYKYFKCIIEKYKKVYKNDVEYKFVIEWLSMKFEW